MPGKHVRFSTQNTFYSPVPELTHSVHSDDDSSSGPSTPPSYHHVHALPGPTPYAPFPSHTDPSGGHSHSHVHAKPHPLLAYSSHPTLTYDLSFHPSSLTTTHHGLSSARMSEPAVYPPQSTLTITTPHLPGAWSFTVSASSRTLGYVTVADVLAALYSGLRTNITRGEFESLGSEKLMRRVTAAYAARYTRLKGHHGYGHEKASGVKRVDYLMGCTTLKGLTSTSKQGVWRVHVA